MLNNSFGRKNKHTEALERAAARAKLTPQEQLAKLDKRLGKGVGARRERARLALMVNKKAA